MNRAVQTLHFMAGVTASGKTEISLEWAQNQGAEILCCDSVAVYQGMNLGSAKPTEKERALVPHHGLDLCPVSENYDVIRFADYARRVVKEVSARGKALLVVGGSGFYLQSFFLPPSDGIQVSDAIREEVESLDTREGRPVMLKRLRALNPEGLGDLDVHNPRRVMRALERCLSSGKTLDRTRRDYQELPKPYAEFSKRMVWLDRENEEIELRISHRTNAMLKEGLVEETRELLEKGMQGNPTAMSSIGYREVIQYIRGQLTKDELPKEINASTRRLVAKQRKWFRNRLPSESRLILKEAEIPDLNSLHWISDS